MTNSFPLQFEKNFNARDRFHISRVHFCTLTDFTCELTSSEWKNFDNSAEHKLDSSHTFKIKSGSAIRWKNLPAVHVLQREFWMNCFTQRMACSAHSAYAWIINVVLKGIKTCVIIMTRSICCFFDFSDPWNFTMFTELCRQKTLEDWKIRFSATEKNNISRILRLEKIMNVWSAWGTSNEFQNNNFRASWDCFDKWTASQNIFSAVQVKASAKFETPGEVFLRLGFYL